MAPVDRDKPVRSAYCDSQYSLVEFVREFPDDASCLEWLWRNRYSEDGAHAYCPKCDRERKFHKVKERPAWDCDTCGHHLHPLAGTIFHKSSTSLHLWFFAIHLMTSTRCGVSAKHLERELGVTYKTAWRMANLIRNKLMTEDQRKLSGYVEVDEASVDGKPRKHMNRSDAARLRERSRATVLAAVERGGRIKATVAS
jgi:transposase-like protein